MIPAEEALTKLIDGNKRFASGARSNDTLTSPAKRDELVKGQHPWAIILGCSDSRVPAELVFDQGLGDLFVIRVAGNIVAPSQIESIEFSAVMHGAKLVVVMGHSNCGAIEATLEQMGKPESERSQNLQAIVGRIEPALETLYKSDLRNQPDELLKIAVRTNVSACVDHLKRGSETLKELVNNQGLVVVGAEYSLETGVVDFFEGVPTTDGTASGLLE